jgi:hypothetical protein
LKERNYLILKVGPFSLVNGLNNFPVQEGKNMYVLRERQRDRGT